MPTNPAPHGPTPARPSSISQTSHLSLEKVIQDHIPSVTATLRTLLSILTAPTIPTASDALESDLRKLCVRAQEGVRKMDMELRVIESAWERVDKERWEVCRGDYKVVMGLVQEVFEVGQKRMEEIGAAGVVVRGFGGLSVRNNR